MPPKKKEDTGEPVYEMGPALIADVFKGFMQNASPTRVRSTTPVGLEEDENEALTREYERLTAIHKLDLQSKAHVQEERTRKRIERRDENRRKEEERILKEKQNNPQNLFNCAQTIQKIMRGNWVREDFARVKASLKERKHKRALFIVVDDYEDPRVRPPKMLKEDAVHMVKILRLWGWHVDFLCNSSKIEAVKPTRANISAALEKAAKVDDDTFLWVHAAGCGGTASVHGKNPHRQAQKEKLALQTPRTRLLNALASMHRRSGGSAATGDICHFLLPCDGTSGRLTFENINTFDEMLDVLEPKHGKKQLYGRALNQRMVTIDIAPFGHIEGLQGGAGCATMASSATGHRFFDYSQASVVDEFQPKRLGILSHCMLEALRGQAWERPQEKVVEPAEPSLSSAADKAPLAPSEGANSPKKAVSNSSKSTTPTAASGGQSKTDQQKEQLASKAPPVVQSLFGNQLPPEKQCHLSVTKLAQYIDETMEKVYVGCEKRGHVWGEIPILSGTDKMNDILAYLDKIYAHTMTPLPKESLKGDDQHTPPLPTSVAQQQQPGQLHQSSTLGVTSNDSFTAAALVGMGGAKAEKANKKKKTASLTRQCLGYISCKVDITEPRDRPDVFSNDFQTVMMQYLTILAQPDPTISAHRYYKVVFPPSFGFYGSPVVSLGINGTFVDIASKAKTKGAEASQWKELEQVIKDGVDLNINTCCGKPEEGGGVVVRIETPDSDTLGHVLNKLDKVPVVLNGFSVEVISFEFTLNCWMAVTGYERLNQFARGLLQVTPLPAAKSDQAGGGGGGGLNPFEIGSGSAGGLLGQSEAALSKSNNNLLLSGNNKGGGGLGGTLSSDKLLGGTLSSTALGEGTIGGGSTASQTLAARRAATQSRQALEHYLNAALSNNSATNAIAKYTRIVGQGHPLTVRVQDAQPMLQRIIDLDDETLEHFQRRERPTGSPLPYNHQGMAICVVALAGGSNEQKINQVREMHKASRRYEGFYNMRFLYWDVTDAIKIDPKETAHSMHPKEKTAKLLEAVRVAAQVRGLPALLIFDLTKKKTFRVRPLETAPALATNPSPSPSSPSPVPPQAAPTPATGGPRTSLVPQQQSSSSPVPPPLGSIAEQNDANFSADRKKSLPALAPSPTPGAGPSPSSTAAMTGGLSSQAAAAQQAQLYYRERTIGLFVEEFVRGALNDLLPPVKGARSYGRGVRNTKYSLLAI